MSEPREEASHIAAGGRPWGPWATVGFGVLVLALWIAVQGIVSVMLAGKGAQNSDAFAPGGIVAWAAIISAPIAIGGAILAARVRKGITVAAYLGLTWPPARQALRSSIILLGFIVASDSLSLALGRSVVPESMIPVYRTAGNLPVFLFGLIVAAPVAEEFLFRGFLFSGFINSRLRPFGSIALTALAWSTLHFQYDFYGVATVAVVGILLGLIRWRTGSLWLCVMLHGLMNVVATVEVAFILSRR